MQPKSDRSKRLHFNLAPIEYVRLILPVRDGSGSRFDKEELPATQVNFLHLPTRPDDYSENDVAFDAFGLCSLRVLGFDHLLQARPGYTHGHMHALERGRFRTISVSLLRLRKVKES